MAINIRYGPDGAALTAAVAGGQASYRERAVERDQAFLARAQQYRLDQERLAIESRRLQQAADAQRRMSGSATPSTAKYINNPLATSVAQAKAPQFSAQPASPGTGYVQSGTERFSADGGVITGTRAGEPVTPEELQRRGGFVETQSSKPMDSRQQYVQAVLSDTNLSPQQQSEIAALGNIPGLTESQLRTAIDGVRRRTGTGGAALDPTFVARERIDSIDNEIRQAQRDLADAERAVQDAGFDPQGPPSQLNPNVRPVGGNIYEAYIGDSGTVSQGGATPDVFRAYSRADELRRQIQQLQAQRSGVLSGGGGAPTATDDLSNLSTDDLLKELLGG